MKGLAKGDDMTARVLEMVSFFLKKSLEEGMDSEARRDLVDSLVEEGHNPNEVHAALSIVENIQRRMDCPQAVVPLPKTNRIFIILEELHLPVEVRGYLSHLRSMGVIDPLQREEIVERLLMMDPDDISVEEVEALLGDVLSNQPRHLGQFDETISDYYH